MAHDAMIYEETPRRQNTPTPGGPAMGPFRDGWSVADVEAVLLRDDPFELLYVPIVISMDPPSSTWSEEICVRLAGHRDVLVRANAILGFGHLARICGKLNEAVVRPIIEQGLREEQPISGQAEDAADDIEHYLKWRISR